MLSKYVNVYFPLCSLVINIVLCFIFFSKKRMENEETKIYTNLLITGLIESILMFTTNLLVGLLFYKVDNIYLQYKMMIAKKKNLKYSIGLM